MFARFPIALSFVSFAVLAVATPGYCGGIPPPDTVTSTVTSTVFQTTTVPAQTITTTKTETVGGTGTCTTTAPAESGTGSPQNCSTGPIQCCESLESASSLPSKIILGLLGIVLQDLEVLLGLNCSPINVIGVGSGDACSAVTVWGQGGLISIGCLPIIL